MRESLMGKKIDEIVIVGGGASGWMAAAMLAKMLGKGRKITLIESADIGIIGVGEATIPAIKLFNKVLGINEADFMKHTQATFKLGIQFEDWGKKGDSYMHAFGLIGAPIGPSNFYNYWLKLNAKGDCNNLWNYSLNSKAAQLDKFECSIPPHKNSSDKLNYAYHFDAVMYAKYLSQYSQSLGVKRIEANVTKVNLDHETGFITSLLLGHGKTISGDLFIDCTGFKALLIEEALKTGYDDWSHWLPINSAVAVPSKKTDGNIPAFTRSIAHECGWQWKIPLQHRNGNGFVYSNKYMNKDEATKTLLDNIDEESLSEPKHFHFTTGKRKKLWNKNCVAIGLSSGFLEPLESTSLYLVQPGIIRLIKLFPSLSFSPEETLEYNEQANNEFECIRDFIILHYKATDRSDSLFWEERQAASIPASLQHKINLFKENGRIFKSEGDIFAEEAWVQVMVGQGITPNSVDVVTEQSDNAQIKQVLRNISEKQDNYIKNMANHNDFIKMYCQSSPY